MLNILYLKNPEDRQKYREIYAKLNRREPHFLLDYIKTFAIGFDHLICFAFTTASENKILMPGYLRPIFIGKNDSGYFDFMTPYGYSGPFIPETNVETEMEGFWSAVDEWYKNNKVVSEFVRFNLFGNHRSYSGTVFPTMLNVKGQIIPEDLQWRTFDRKVRKNYNKAVREGLTVKVFYKDISVEQISEFYHVYIDTMKRTNAASHFFYTHKQLAEFIQENTEFVAICTVHSDDVAISSELLLVSEDSVYSFLGGTIDDHFEKRPNDYLKVEVLNWARQNKIKYYVLGGGYGYDDGIFKYKKAFFPENVVTYYTGRKIIDSDNYASLVAMVSAYNLSQGNEPLNISDNSYFPLYRKH